MKTKKADAKKEKKPGRIKHRLIIAAIIAGQFLIASFISMMLVVHGPYETIRKNLIGTAMTTFSHQYIATMLFSQKQIDEVVNAGKNIKTDTQDLPAVTPQNYNDPNIQLEKIDSKSGAYTGYMLKINDPLRVKVALTDFIGKSGENTSDMARKKDAVAAINGGGFGAGTGAYPSDFVIADGKLAWKDPNLSNDTECNVIALDAGGHLIVDDHSLAELQSRSTKIISAVTLHGCSPLVVNGKGVFKYSDSSSFAGVQPRTAIGQTGNGTILMLVIDGRRLNMPGATLYEVQKIMLDYGAVTATYLDGGNSSIMYYDGGIVNNPSGEFGERTVATAFYVEK